MKFKKLLSLGLSFVLSFSFVFFLPLSTISADPVSFDFPSSWFSSNVSSSDQAFYNSCITNLKSNSSFSSFDSDYLIVGFRQQFPGNYLYFIINPVYQGSDVYFGDYFFGDYAVGDISDPSQLSSISLNFYSFDSVPTSSVGRLNSISFLSSWSVSNAYISRGYQISSSSPLNALFNVPLGFIPDSNSYQLTGFIVGSDTSMEAFYQWIIDNNKLSELPSYIVSSKLKSLIDFYHTYGGSLTAFIHYLPQWLSYVSLPSQTSENANILKNKLDALYSEFINQYIVTVTRDRSQQLAHHRNGIYTVTDDSDTSLITDDVNDDTITSILRDILRGVIQITNSIYDNTSALIEKIDSINFTATVVNNGGVPSGTDINPLLQKMDDIIEALQADTVSVEIDQTTQDDTDQFLSDWADEFSVELDSKFPVINQLGTLFSDDFFEKCGIDTDGDGEVYEYYNPEVALYRSAPAGSESYIVSDFLDQFDDSDPAFLDNVSFSESVPDWSVSIAGTKVSVFSFKLYAKYRTWIHTIISFIIWTCFLLGLYKSLPGLIGNVANTFDVSHDIFDSKSTSNNKG